MVNRVTTKLNDGTQGLFISKPGIDVLTAEKWQMVFDSRFDYTASVIVEGTATRGSTIAFPTQAFVPIVFVAIVSGGNLTGMRYNQSTIQDAIVNGYDTGYNYVEKRLVEPIYKVTTSSLEFIDDYVAQYDPSGGYTVRYSVLRVPGAT